MKMSKKVLPLGNTARERVKGNTTIINNSIDCINLLKNKDIVSIKSYDFEDLFNSIEIKDLYEKLILLFDEFQLVKYIDKSKYKHLIDFVLFENYLFNGVHVYKQINGIPQGGSASSILANLYLHFYENLQTNVKDIYVIYRYIDDILIAFFKKYNLLLDFYPRNLTLKLTNSNDKISNFLDLNINISDQTKFNIFDKRDEFNFNISILQNWYSNLSRLIHKNIILNQCLRIKRIITLDSDKMDKQAQLFNLSVKNGYPKQFVMDLIYN